MFNNRLFLLGLMLLAAASGFSQSNRFKFQPKDSLQQREYDEFLTVTKAERTLADSLSYLEAEKFFELNGEEEPLKPYVAQKEKAQRRHEQVVFRFIEDHPQYAVSAAYVKYMYQQSFRYTAEDYDYYESLVKECPDTSYTNFLTRNHDLVRRYTIGVPYTDIEGLTPQGEQKALSTLMQPGRYTLVDFWASWCGPCRSAIPRLKEMAGRYRDRLQIVSVSVDEKEDAWRKAEKQEAMPWPQLWAKGELMDKAAQAYWIESIPRLVLTGPDGRVVVVTYSPSVIDETLRSAFSLTVQVPGIPTGAEVTIETTGDHRETLASARATDGPFTLYGRVRQSTYARICINDRAEYAEGEHPRDRGVELCIEPGQTMTVRATCLDSIPLTWEMNSSPLPKEPNVSITGGPMQQHFAEYKQAVRPAALACWQAVRDWRAAEYGFDRKPDRELAALLKPAADEAEQALTEATTRFIASHPDYSISLRLQQERMEDMFRYSDSELDEMLVRFAHNEDTLRYRQFQEQVAALRHYTSGTPYTDLEVMTPEGRQCCLSDFIRQGTPTFVDFWASWCGPCRQAIPEVKQLAAQYGDRLTILSVSVDRDEKAWRRAMDEEQMPWQQLLIPREGMKALAEGYQVNSIPYLLLIDQQGQVVVSSHSPEDIEMKLRAGAYE